MQMTEEQKGRTVERTTAEKMVMSLDYAAWAVGTSEGRIPAVGYVQIDRVGRRRHYRLDGAASTARAIYERARLVSAEAFRIAQESAK